MKIKLNKEELKKCYNLLDVKEINISIAELLFSIYQVNEPFLNASNEEDYYRKLLNYWDIPQDDKENLALLDKWVKGTIKCLNPHYFDENPYFKAVKPHLFKNKKYELKYDCYEAYQPFALDDIQVDEAKDFMEKTPVGYFPQKIDFLSLRYNNDIWMSLTPNEINTMNKSIKEAKGNVLVFGLGLGYYPFMVSLKNSTQKITIIEKDEVIIDIFKKELLPLFPYPQKIEIIKSDAKDFISKMDNRWGTLFIDLWHNALDGISLYLFFKKHEKKYPQTRFQYWLEESMIALYRRCMLTVFEESLNNYDDSDYQNNKEDIDKIINDIYFKTKNITISSYDDIHKLLTRDSIKELIK